MAQKVTNGGSSQSLAANDTAVVRFNSLEQGKVTITAAAAATLTLQLVNGYLVIGSNAAVTVAQ